MSDMTGPWKPKKWKQPSRKLSYWKLSNRAKRKILLALKTIAVALLYKLIAGGLAWLVEWSGLGTS